MHKRVEKIPPGRELDRHQHTNLLLRPLLNNNPTSAEDTAVMLWGLGDRRCPPHPTNVSFRRGVPMDHLAFRHIPKETQFSRVLQSTGRGWSQP